MRTTPGTWRVEDESAVDWKEAVAAWSSAALPVLEHVAGRYDATIEYKELAEAIQAATGIRTRLLLTNWIGQVPGSVAKTQPADEPTLTSLVVHADGTTCPKG